MDCETASLLEQSRYFIAESEAVGSKLKSLTEQSRILIEYSRGLILNIITVQEPDTRPRSR